MQLYLHMYGSSRSEGLVAHQPATLMYRPSTAESESRKEKPIQDHLFTKSVSLFVGSPSLQYPHNFEQSLPLLKGP